MSVTLAIGEALKLANFIIDKYVDSPEEKMKAKREYIEKLKMLKLQALEARDAEELDRYLRELVIAVRS